MLRRAPFRWWYGSLRLRVITTMVALGVALGTLLGSVLYQLIAGGLVDQAIESAQRDASQQVALAQEAFDSTDLRDDSGLTQAAEVQVQLLAGANSEDGRRVLLTPSLTNERGVVVPTVAVGLSLDAIPRTLLEAIDADPENQQIVVVPLQVGNDSEPVAAVLVGSRVSLLRAGAYDLVLAYPMLREQESLDLVRQLLLASGFMLVLLVGSLGWVATRMVTRPVAEVARVSQQLAQGELSERVPVTGTDEISQLAKSFNLMADSIQHQIRELRTLSQLQQRFASDVSHELRTPLTTMRMAGDLLHAYREDFPEPVARSAELLQQEMDRFEELLTELLEISRYDSGATTLERHDEDLNPVVRNAVQGIESLATSLGSAITVRLPALPVIVDMDGRRIARVLRNLLANAVEHGEGRPIWVTLAMTEDVVAVSVADRGIGMDAEQQSHVFERFWRADPSRNRTTGGTGLGLAIALEDARQHGGWLQVGSAPGLGTCFRLLLPRDSRHVIAEEPPPVPVPTEAGPVGLDQVPPVVLVLAVREGT